jgi:hypothetical protein
MQGLAITGPGAKDDEIVWLDRRRLARPDFPIWKAVASQRRHADDAQSDG